MSAKTPSKTVVFPEDPAIFRTMIASPPFNRARVTSGSSTQTVATRTSTAAAASAAIPTTPTNADGVVTPGQVTAQYNVAVKELDKQNITTDSTDSVYSKTAMRTTVSATGKSMKVSAVDNSDSIKARLIVPKRLYNPVAVRKVSAPPTSINSSPISARLASDSLDPNTGTLNTTSLQPSNTYPNIFTTTAQQTIVDVNGSGPMTTDPSYNFTVTTASDRSVVIAGLTNAGTDLVEANEVSIYNTDKDIYVTGIDQGTTQQYITLNDPGGVTGQLQFNNNGQFAGATGVTYSSQTRTLVAQNFGVTGNTALGSVSNVKIMGGSTGQVLTTDGSGNLSWANTMVASIPPYTVAFADASGEVVGSNTFQYKPDTGYFVLNQDNYVDDPENVLLAAASANTASANAGGSMFVTAGDAQANSAQSAGSTTISAGSIRDNGVDLAAPAMIVIEGLTDVPGTQPMGGTITITAAEGTGNIVLQTGGGDKPIYSPTLTSNGEILLHTVNPSPLPDQPYSALSPGANGQVMMSQGADKPPVWGTLPSTYVLPVATDTTLGGVKIGENVSVTPDGTISVPDIPRTIPELHDVDASAPVANGSILIWNSSTSMWTAGTVLDRQIIEGGEYGI